LVDPADEGLDPALLFLLTHEIKLVFMAVRATHAG
jgi:hypothetical protein